MARIAFLIKHPKRTLGALAVLVASTGLVVGSGATFSASSANPSNTLATGSLSILNDKEGSAILVADGMRPGGAAVTGTVDIRNTGSMSGTFTLSRTAPVDSDPANPLSAQLDLVVKDCGLWSNATTPNPCGDGDDTVVYGSPGTLAGMTGNVALGTFAAGAKHRYEFSAQVKGSAGDVYQGAETEVEFTWSAVQ